ncbi:uncharacterized protein BDW43DRAFT_286875 [Aspergillus alliaceus]|uniref:uncharacterized protein n=1 Tax=Petromyces alliaceus TaxID=209559 RepID=UPI0012A5A253|nr:uncharacterized protein BDW43DRAFT_286875 [Aspergillus alliaceus]KAB8230120.1 hypothetical protein BDW43DRAFT_286875 [Aspergillus alliaceus]
MSKTLLIRRTSNLFYLKPSTARASMNLGIKRVIFSSGQVYAPLSKHCEAQSLKDAAITRIEELHPSRGRKYDRTWNAYPYVTDIVWCQEETL